MRARVTRCLLAGLIGLGASACRTRPYELDGIRDLSVLPDDLTLPPSDGPPIPPDYNFPAFDLTIPRNNCGVYTIQTTQVIRAQLLIILDRSRSMAQGAGGENSPAPGQSKWELVRAAVKQVVAKTTTVDWGLLLFGTGQQCRAPATPEVPVGANKAALISQTLDNAQFAPSTPTTAAINNSVAYMRGLSDKQPRYLMVATDGQPTCRGGAGNADDSAAAIAAVKSSAAAGLPVFVVGIGANTGAHQTLDAMGRGGGAPNTTPGKSAYFTVNSTQDLVDVLEAAALRITPCTYPLPALPPAPDRVLIQSRGGIVPRDLTHNDGWDYSGNLEAIVFYGESCKTLQIGVVLSVEAVYGCPGDML